MMELVLRTFDKDGESARRRGDVISVGRPETQWGRCVRKNPAFLVIRAPISEKEAGFMLATEPGHPLQNLSLAARHLYLDIDSLANPPDAGRCRDARYPAGMDSSDYLSGPDIPIVEITREQFTAMKKTREPRGMRVLGASDVLGE